MNLKIKIYILLQFIVLSQTIPLTPNNVSKNNKSIVLSSTVEDEEAVSTSENVESSEIEENINLNRTKKSPTICIRLYDDGQNCGCGKNHTCVSIENNECDHSDKNCNCSENNDTQGPSGISTSTETTPEEKKQTEKPCNLIGPFYVKKDCNGTYEIARELTIPDGCPVCGSTNQQNIDSENSDKQQSTRQRNSNSPTCNCLNNLVRKRTDQLTTVIYDKDLYETIKQDDINDSVETTPTTTMPTSIQSKKTYIYRNKQIYSTTTEKPKKLDEEKLKRLFKELQLSNQKLNNYLEQQKVQNSNKEKDSSTAKLIAKQGRSRLYKSGRNKENVTCNDEDHHNHHHKSTIRSTGRRISARSATESTILSTTLQNNDPENSGSMKKINLSTTELLNIMKNIENSSATKIPV